MDVSKLFNPAGKKLDISQYAEAGDFVTLKVISIIEKYELLSNYSNGVNVKKAAEYLQEKGMSLKEISNEMEENPNKLFELLTDVEMKEVMKNVDIAQNIRYKINVLSAGVDKDKHSFTNGQGNPVILDSKFWENLGTFSNPLFEFIYDEVEKYQKEYSLGEPTGKISNTRS